MIGRTFYRHLNRHRGDDGPWGWITESPDWQSRAVAYWSGWAGGDGAAVLCGHPAQPDHDIRLPWAIVPETRKPWEAESWRVVNAAGYTVLASICDLAIAEEAVRRAAAAATDRIPPAL